MKLLLLLYLAGYAAASIWGVREDLKERAPAWKPLLATVETALGLGGMWLFLSGPADPTISRVWAFVFPFLIVAGLIDVLAEFRHGLQRMLPAEDRGDPQLRSLVWLMVFGSLLVTFPFYWVNFRLAYDP
jgi:hypothetical protein